MKQPLRNPDPKITLLSMLSMLCLMLIVLTPGAAAAARTTARHNADTRMSAKIRVENGIVTDDDGIIGNSASGADHAPHHRHHRAHRTSPFSSRRMGRARDQAPTLSLTADALPCGSDAAGTLADGRNGMLSGDGPFDGMPEARTGDEGLLPEADELLPDTDNGKIDASDPSDESTARDGGVLALVLAIIAGLAVVLIVLALIPKKGRARR